MTESVARVKILAQIEGLEGFDKLKGAFKGLQTAIGPADSELEKARKSVLEFGKAGKASEQVIQGQISALKALQGQATVGGTVYRQLAKDVKALGGAYQEAATGVKQFTDAQLKSQIVGSKPSTFDKQISALRRGLQDLSVYSRQYAEALTEIQRRQLPFNTALGRQNVIAAASAYAQGGKGGAALPELPNTNAALAQRIQEVTDRLANLTRGSESWRQAANELRRLNSEVANGFQFMGAGAAQAKARLEEMRRTMAAAGSGFAKWSQNPTALTDSAAAEAAIQKSIERNRRKRGVAGAQLYDSPIGPPEASELFRNIAGIGNQTAANQAQLMGRSYQEVANRIKEVGRASDGSVNSLQRQRASWEALRNSVDANGREFREATRELAALDKQLERTQPGGLRGKIGYIGQGIGAAASAGIFGGPEGALGGIGGGAIGALLGGPAGFAAGSFIGSSVGAYAGMGRQALGGFSTYAADISKLEIALKGVTKTQDEYQRALAASASVTRDFNVPQLEATRGMTQLSAAVIGAGGKVADAEVVFRNVTAAIKASGGTSEDVQGALTALGQIFSKGKVSAEELQGQLGERLPGAVTMFAKATGRTLPQLQKDLEQGVVGLADLMKFVTSDQGLGQFEQRAKDVAKSSADAGARLTATWNDTKRAIGEAILPLGAQIQDSLAGALKAATPALVEIAKALAGFVKLIVDNAGAIAAIGKFALTLGGAAVSVKAFGLLLGPIQQGLGLLAMAFGKTTAQAVVTEARLKAFGVTAKTLARSLAAPILLTVGIIGAEVVWNWLSRIKEAKDRLKGATSDIRGEAWVKSIGGAALDTEALTKQVSAAGKAYQLAADKIKAYKSELNSTPFKPRKEFLQQQIAAEEAVLKLAESRYKAGIEELSTRKGDRQPTGLTDFSNPEGKDSAKAAADKAAQDAARLAAEEQRLNEETAKAQIELSKTVFNNQIELIRKRWDYEEERTRQQRDLWAGTFEGVRGESARAAVELATRLEAIRRRLREATLGVVTAESNAGFAQQMEAVTSQGLGG